MNTRIRRLQLRRGAFHITACTQGRERWFVPQIRSSIVDIITGETSCTDARLLALAVMPNHLHIILMQHALALGRLMQPVLRRIALRVQRTHGLKGHVFEGRFFSELLETPDHVREAIVYTHRNPVKARLCTSVDEYEWTSHAAYIERDCGWNEHIDIEAGLRLFAETPECDIGACRDSYLRWLARRDPETPSLDVQLCTEGNVYFASRFATGHQPEYPGQDLRDMALKALSFITNDYRLQDLRGSYLTHRAAGVRKHIIAFLLMANHPTGKISSFFAVSPATVSKVANELKWRRAEKSRGREGNSAGFPFSFGKGKRKTSSA